MTAMNRTGAPVMYIVIAGVMIVGTGGHLGVFWLDHPVGKVDKVRFIPEGSWAR